jgi:endonuclease III
MPALTKHQRNSAILARLAQTYPHATTALHHKNTFQLLIAVILSAQCTDARVNLATPALFARFPTPEAMAAAPLRKLESLIRSCGFFRVKAKNIKNASRILVDRFAGRVPRTMDELLELPGVGRKTANVILATAYGEGAIAVDTHVFRVANRLGLAHAKTPAKTEQQLMQVVPKKDWSHVSHWLIFHGRQICHARNPECIRCPLVDLCPSAKRFLIAARRKFEERGVKDRF